MTNEEAIHQVLADYRMPSPENCPAEVYDIMLRCWHKDPEERPTFRWIFERLQRIYEEFSAVEQTNTTTDHSSTVTSYSTSNDTGPIYNQYN